MTKNQLKNIEKYLCEQAEKPGTNRQNNVYEKEHINRVCMNAMILCDDEPGADRQVVAIAALLHDVGRGPGGEGTNTSHAERGADMARDYLRENGFDLDLVERVSECIRSHSRRGGNSPKTLEAKILYDADKLDMDGALGVARLLQYGAYAGKPLYTVDAEGVPEFGKKMKGASVFKDYRRKMRKKDEDYYTGAAKRLAKKRRRAAKGYFKALAGEVAETYAARGAIETLCEDEPPAT